jgi:hypothetical protein
MILRAISSMRSSFVVENPCEVASKVAMNSFFGKIK